jgi:signal transduction histidine kinase/ActR/RegA family two-component response regulator
VVTRLSAQHLLEFARRLHGTHTFAELLQAAREEISAAIGYQQVWFFIMDNDAGDELRLVEFAGTQHNAAWKFVPILKVQGDPFLEELVKHQQPLVIEDSRIDPRTNKQLVEQLRSRTLVNVPMHLVDKPLGFLGTGTFGDEGCRVPSEEEMAYLLGMAGQIAVAAGRIRLLAVQAEAEAERLTLERRIQHVERMESLGMLAAGVAHDFGNLLTVILTAGAQAHLRAGSEALERDLGAIVDAAERARELTGQLLRIGRAQELEPKPIDLNVHVTRSLALVRRLLPPGVEVEFVQGAELPLVQADATQLDRVLLNLVVNARDAMPNGGRLTVETEEVVVNDSYVELHPWAKRGRYLLTTVTDTGIGMSQEVLRRVFEPFFTTKRDGISSGLGLAVTYGIVRQHGGMLHCYSEESLGTSFKIYLPASEQMRDALPAKASSRAPSGSERLLVADDDPAIRGTLLRILRSAGYEVRVTENGAAALRAIEAEAFDVVILDVVMPGLRCDEVLKRIRTLRPSTRVLLSSGYTAESLAGSLLETKDCGFLGKPYNPDELLREVRRAVDLAASL